MPLQPNDPADTAAAAASHLWHLTYLLAGSPGQGWPGALKRWCDLASELTILSEQLRSAAAGRRSVPFDDGRVAHVAALRVAILEVLECYQGEHPRALDLPFDDPQEAAPPVSVAAPDAFEEGLDDLDDED
jgi:hypothetical protein